MTQIKFRVKQPLLNHNSKMWWCQNSNGLLSVQAPTPLSSMFLSTTAIPTVKPSPCMSFGIQPVMKAAASAPYW